MHKDDQRKERYYQRHGERNLKDFNRPKFWSHNLLWNKKTLRESINDT